MQSEISTYRRPYRTQRLRQEEKQFCCIVYPDEPSKYSIVELKRLIDIDERGYGSIKEFGKTFGVHVEQTGVFLSKVFHEILNSSSRI